MVKVPLTFMIIIWKAHHYISKPWELRLMDTRLQCRLVTIDDILKEKSLNGPYLIWICQRMLKKPPLDVLQGSQEALSDTEAVVLEVSMFGFMKGAPQFYDVVSYMKQHYFVAYDIILHP